MSATPPFGPAYGQPSDEGPRPDPGRWQPQAGHPRAAGGEQRRPEDEPQRYGPQAGRPAAGQGPQGPQRPAAGGRPQAGGSPQAGRGSARPPQPNQSPQGAPHPQQQPSTPPHGQQPVQRPTPPPRPAEPERSPEPFEEAAFADDPGSWGGGEETTAIGKLGYVPKETRRRSDFQKVRSRARKTSPVPKILIGIVVVALIGGAGWWWFNHDGSDDAGEDSGPALTYGNVDEPCDLVDTAPLDSVADGAEPEMTGSAEERRRGFEQSCVVNYGPEEGSTARIEFDGTVYESDAKAAVNYELSSTEVSEMTDSWTVIDPAPEVGEQTAAVASVVDEGTSNYQLHLQDANVYLIVRLSVVDSGLDEQGLTELTAETAQSYLAAWDEAA